YLKRPVTYWMVKFGAELSLKFQHKIDKEYVNRASTLIDIA
ncbi:MAG: hypothetical protein ACI89W_002039, partial [Gammaproteobacteria bacterium]